MYTELNNLFFVFQILEPRESPSESAFGREIWFNNRRQPSSTTPTNVQNDDTLVQNNNNINSASTISSCDISGLNVDFLFNGKESPSVTATNCPENPDYLSFVDDFLKNTFPSTGSFDSTDLETSIDMMNIEPFNETADNSRITPTTNIPTTTNSATFYTSTNASATYHNRLQNNSPANSSALSLGTF